MLAAAIALLWAPLPLALGCALTPGPNGTQTCECTVGPLHSAPRVVAGLTAPNLTLPNGSTNLGACGCDPPLPSGGAAFQLNKPCPLNAEPLLGYVLAAGRTTPPGLFLKRNHGPVPLLEDPDAYQLVIRGAVNSPLNLTLADLKNTSRFERVEVEALLCCAGNRRTEMGTARCPSPSSNGSKAVDGVPWGAAALGNAVWGGVRLADVLEEAGVASGARWVEFEGADVVKEETQADSDKGFASALPIGYAMDASNDVMLAFDLNGAPLPPEHGAPLRNVVPGQLGARSVKWLVYITLLETESTSYFMQRDYKLFPPDVLPDEEEEEGLPVSVWNASPPLQDLNVQLGITAPASPDNNTAGSGTLASVSAGNGSFNVEGFTFSGGGRYVQAVYVCLLPHLEAVERCDNVGWLPADLSPSPEEFQQALLEPGAEVGRFYSWSTWNVTVAVPGPPPSAGLYNLVARAIDVSGNSMPQTSCPIWNWRGVMNNAWMSLPVSVE